MVSRHRSASRKRSVKRSTQSRRRSSAVKSCPRMVGSHKIPTSFSGYCVKCRSKRTGKTTSVFTTKNKRNGLDYIFACSKCPRCDTKMCRILGTKQ